VMEPDGDLPRGPVVADPLDDGLDPGFQTGPASPIHRTCAHVRGIQDVMKRCATPSVPAPWL
jgi:hypothetical protein